MKTPSPALPWIWPPLTLPPELPRTTPVPAEPEMSGEEIVAFGPVTAMPRPLLSMRDVSTRSLAPARLRTVEVAAAPLNAIALIVVFGAWTFRSGPVAVPANVTVVLPPPSITSGSLTAGSEPVNGPGAVPGPLKVIVSAVPVLALAAWIAAGSVQPGMWLVQAVTAPAVAGVVGSGLSTTNVAANAEGATIRAATRAAIRAPRRITR